MPKAGGRANDGNSVSDEELAMLKNRLFQAISEIFPFLQYFQGCVFTNGTSLFWKIINYKDEH